METYQKINTVCLFILTLVAVAFVLSVTKTVLIPFVLAVFIALVFSPLMHRLQKKFKLPRGIVLTGTFIAFTLFFLLVSYVTAESVEKFAQNSNQYKEKLQGVATYIVSMAEQLGFQFDEESIKGTLKKLPFTQAIKTISTSVVSLFSNTFLVIVFTLFMLSGESMDKGDDESIVKEIKLNVAKYVGTKILTSGGTGLLTFVVLKSFGVEMSFMFATLTFLLNFIPTIGSIVAVILPLPIMLLQFGIGGAFAGCLILMVGIQLIIGNVLEPKIMGESTGLHPVTILLSLTFWGLLWGVTGMFLSVPITATLKIIFSNFELTKPIAHAFAGEFKTV